MRLTERAHALVAPHLRPGDIAIDTTAGNGWDTAFLLRHVGPHGLVYAFDIQADALATTRQRIANTPGHEQVRLICSSHAALADHIPADAVGRVKAVMFNLGYRPGGDHATVTTAPSTLAALEAAQALLHPEGIMSVLAYRGHPGGTAEADAITRWIARSGLVAERFGGEIGSNPVLWRLTPVTPVCARQA
jgi:predicted methyltransferase